MYIARFSLLCVAAQAAALLLAFPAIAQPTNPTALLSAVTAAAEAGDPRARHDLGVFCMNGTGVPH